MPNAIRQVEGGVELQVRVQPRASRNAVRMEADGQVRIALMAPPVEGAANAALCVYVAGLCGVAKRAVKVVSGEKSREKRLLITGIDMETVRTALAKGA